MKKRLLWTIIVLTISCVAYLSYRHYFPDGNHPYRFRTTGTVEATEYTVASKISGRLTRVMPREGDTVKEGELVADISSEELLAERDSSLGAVRSASAVAANSGDELARARTNLDTAKAEVESAKAGVDLAQAALDLAEKDHARAVELFGKGVISQSELDRAVNSLDTAKAAFSSAKAALAVSESNVKSVEAAVKSAGSSLAASRARVSEAETGVGVMDARLEDTRILSPADGIVEYRILEPGEVVAPGTPILTLIDPSDAWVRIDVDERYIHDIKEGSKADVSLEYAPEKSFPATVYDIGREANFATERDVTRGRQDIRTFRVRMRYEDPDGALKPGMTVIVTFPVEK